MTTQQQTDAARLFAQRWEGRGYEKGDTHSFWIELLEQVLGVANAPAFIDFEVQVKLDHTSFIDALIRSTRVLIEQKSLDKSLTQLITQSDGSRLTPFRQAVRYAANLPYSERPRWIVVSNFAELHIHDMEQPDAPPQVILLKDLEREVHRLRFLVDASVSTLRHREEEVSIAAGRLVGQLYDLLLPQYVDPTSPRALHSLNILCVRLVFCMYAEDAGLFGERDAFCHYFHRFTAYDFRDQLIRFFRVLDTPIAERDPYLDDALAAFPYVNGGLFADDDIEIPRFTPDIIRTLIDRASYGFDWSHISPTIFGAVFESTLNPETRRAGGMHYTSVENIHRVIDPLFLDPLRDELAAIRAERVALTRRRKLMEFQEHLASLRFLDPACGSGNFLTETYLSLRRLENEALRTALGDEGQIQLGGEFSPIRVNINQFFGIEINDFAAIVAKTALWIAESQMLRATASIVGHELDFFPLASYAGIVEGNALRMDWSDVCPREELSYIIGNPPFVGYSLQSKAQKEDVLSIYRDEKGKPYKTAGKIDYVACWYWKASELMQGTNIRAALVSTNSICQGEQVAAIWQPLVERFGTHIDFAHRTFRWDSEAQGMAHVHCVIVGFSTAENKRPKRLFGEGGVVEECENINFYLAPAKNVFVIARSKPLCDVPILQNGGKPTEGGFLILTEDEKKELLRENPKAEAFIRPYMMGKDFIYRQPRYCLWMVEVSPAALKQCPKVIERIKKVRQYRLASPKAATQRKADTPMLFDEVRACKTDYVAIPKVSSERRDYIPIDYLKAEIIPGDKLFMLEGSTLYHFGVLTSSSHNAWMRTVCGRLEMRYSYSNTIVYNNFPWPNATEEQQARIAQTAQAILDARARYPEASLADLYDPIVMPPELRRAHRDNDHAVMAAYGFAPELTEPEVVAELMSRYEELTK